MQVQIKHKDADRIWRWIVRGDEDRLFAASPNNNDQSRASDLHDHELEQLIEQTHGTDYILRVH